jgi:hypothetical protein
MLPTIPPTLVPRETFYHLRPSYRQTETTSTLLGHTSYDVSQHPVNRNSFLSHTSSSTHQPIDTFSLLRTYAFYLLASILSLIVSRETFFMKKTPFNTAEFSVKTPKY